MQEKFINLEIKLVEQIKPKLDTKDFETYMLELKNEYEVKFRNLYRETNTTRGLTETTKSRTEDIAIRLANAEALIDGKMPIHEGKKIYETFKVYAKYDDLKDLHSKVVPPIYNFEDKLV